MTTPSPTLSTSILDLILAVRQRTNTENSQFVTDAELTSYITNSLAEMDDLLVSRYEDYKLSNVINTLPINGADATNAFPLPADFLKLRGFEYSVDGTHWITLKRFNFQMRNNGSYGFAISPYGRSSATYRIEGDNIIVMPQDQSAGQYQLWYTPEFELIDVGNGPSLPSYMDVQAWHEYATVDTSIKVLQKQNLDPSIFMAQKEALKDRILSAASNRDAGSPKKIANTRFRTGRNRNGSGYDY